MITGEKVVFPFIDDKDNIREDGIDLRTYIATHILGDVYKEKCESYYKGNSTSSSDADIVKQAVALTDLLIAELNKTT